MPDRWNTNIFELKGGLVTNLSQLQHGITAPGSARILRNFEPSVFGGYRRIEGYEKHDTNAIPNTGVVRGILRYKGNVYVARGVDIFRSAGSGWTQITNNATFSSTGVTLGSGSGKVRFLKYDFDGTEKFMVVDNDTGNKPFTFDNSTFQELTGLPNDTLGCNHVVNFKNHVFLANAKKLIFSAPYDDTDFTSASGGGIINIADNITGLIVFRDQLIIFSENKIHRLVGNSVADFALQPVSRDLGCIAEDTIQEIGGDILFLGPDGLRTFSATDRVGDFALGVISKPIQEEMLDLTSSSSSFTSIVVREKSQYRIFGYNASYQSSGAKAVAGTQLQEGISWNEIRGIKAYVAFSEYVGNTEFIYFANETDYLYRMEQGNTFDGTNITATFATPYVPLQDPNLRKTVFRNTTYIDANGAFELQMSIKYDFDQTGSVQPLPVTLNNASASSFFYGAGIFGTSAYGNKARYIYDEPVTGSGFTVSILYETLGQTTDSTFTIDSATIQYGLYGRR